jgi:hypothetical protein
MELAKVSEACAFVEKMARAARSTTRCELSAAVVLLGAAGLMLRAKIQESDEPETLIEGSVIPALEWLEGICRDAAREPQRRDNVVSAVAFRRAAAARRRRQEALRASEEEL